MASESSGGVCVKAQRRELIEPGNGRWGRVRMIAPKTCATGPSRGFRVLKAVAVGPNEELKGEARGLKNLYELLLQVG